MVPRFSANVKEAFLVMLVLTFVAVTHHRNAVYLSPETLWLNGVPRQSFKARVHNHRGNIYYIQRRLNEAMAEYHTATILDKHYYETWPNYYRCCTLYENNDSIIEAMNCYDYYCRNAPPLFHNESGRACENAARLSREGGGLAH